MFLCVMAVLIFIALIVFIIMWIFWLRPMYTSEMRTTDIKQDTWMKALEWKGERLYNEYKGMKARLRDQRLGLAHAKNALKDIPPHNARLLKLTRLAWADLAKELRDTYHDKDGQAAFSHTLVMGKLMTNYASVSRIMAFQEREFKKLYEELEVHDQNLKRDIDRRSATLEADIKKIQDELEMTTEARKRAFDSVFSSNEQQLDPIFQEMSRRLEKTKERGESLLTAAKKTLYEESVR